MICVFMTLIHIMNFVCGLWITPKTIEFDYSEWLGPDYKEKYKKGVTAPIVICNHITHLDPVIAYMYCD